jgi:hypothetical protein
MYQTTTENGKYKFVIHGDVPKVYRNDELWEQGGYSWLTLLIKLQKYEEALKFYANKENYECDDESLNPAVSYIHIVDMDEGDKARQVLNIK